MSAEIAFGKDQIDSYLKEVAKQYKKLNRKGMPAEITLIGGASILINYGFRESTYDIDALIYAASSMKDAINYVTDTMGLPNGWLNDDFKHTTSYTPRLVSLYDAILAYICITYGKFFDPVLNKLQVVIGLIIEHTLFAVLFLKHGEYEFLNCMRSSVIGMACYDDLISVLCVAEIVIFQLAEKICGFGAVGLSDKDLIFAHLVRGNIVAVEVILENRNAVVLLQSLIKTSYRFL